MEIGFPQSHIWVPCYSLCFCEALLIDISSGKRWTTNSPKQITLQNAKRPLRLRLAIGHLAHIASHSHIFGEEFTFLLLMMEHEKWAQRLEGLGVDVKFLIKFWGGKEIYQHSYSRGFLMPPPPCLHARTGSSAVHFQYFGAPVMCGYPFCLQAYVLIIIDADPQLPTVIWLRLFCEFPLLGFRDCMEFPVVIHYLPHTESSNPWLNIQTKMNDYFVQTSISVFLSQKKRWENLCCLLRCQMQALVV